MIAGGVSWALGTLYSAHKQKKATGKVNWLGAISDGAAVGYTVMSLGLAATSVKLTAKTTTTKTQSKGTNSNIHGNSKLSIKTQHGYEIYERSTGDVVKTGISGRPLNVNGTSPRANTQVNKLNSTVGFGKFGARVVETNLPNRQAALEWEAGNAMRLWENGNSMSIHKRPIPWDR